ncbi:unnamed protein product [Kuraishia capsulata CBS 1993]|uniref:ESCRT-II complex subunit VPS25 n=1 Tax=Kuraishia capsulata CBS 1993 TaxID=1382522 RepID=W6MPL1_9ASCO|nr:uncharacterized protein KUCA_T00003044001 [Kuraishia capsulata CBS 1993]CDK27067.1 unnamed protein product [Kuraishia capsulata CBS 1993]
MDNKPPFTYPALYDFPPFFTKQPNSQTWQSQLSNWVKLLLAYCKHNRIWILSPDGTPLTATSNDDDSDNEEFVPSTESIFNNEKIQRSIKPDMSLEILNTMVSQGKAKWKDPKNHKMGIYIYWYSLEAWADMIYDWIENTGQQNSVLTIYEIRKGELGHNQEFHNMDMDMFISVLELMVKKGQAQLIRDEDGSIAGIKVV